MAGGTRNRHVLRRLREFLIADDNALRASVVACAGDNLLNSRDADGVAVALALDRHRLTVFLSDQVNTIVATHRRERDPPAGPSQAGSDVVLKPRPGHGVNHRHARVCASQRLTGQQHSEKHADGCSYQNDADDQFLVEGCKRKTFLDENKRPEALIQIGNHTVKIAYVYLEVVEGGLMPSVPALDIFGTDKTSGKAIHEHVTRN